MKPPERCSPDDPREWLNRARSSLAIAKNRVTGVYLEDLCFGAQQAAEKAIKAVMMKQNIDFPYVHDLGRLLTLLKESGIAIPPAIARADELTPYAVDTRYPGTAEPVDEKQYREVIETAESVVRWAQDRLRVRSGPPLSSSSGA